MRSSSPPLSLPRSPLRYPGGKSRAARAIAEHIPQTEPRLCSPFLGGGWVELALSSRMDVSAFDSFGPLVSFWEELLENPSRLAQNARTYYPLERETFYRLQENIFSERTRAWRAAKFFVLNRASFSGVTLSGGMSPGHPRFTLSAIRRVEQFERPRRPFTVKCRDFRDVIPAHPNHFLYLDPPYLIKSDNLYGVRGSNHKGFDHRALFELLSKRDRWVLSYNDSPQIRDLYRGYRIEPLSWVYGMGNDKRSREILILSEKEPQ